MTKTVVNGFCRVSLRTKSTYYNENVVALDKKTPLAMKGGGKDDDIFYNDFDNDEDEEDEDEEYDDMDVSSFRSKMESLMGDGNKEDSSSTSSSTKEDVEESSFSSVDELISFATTSSSASPTSSPTDWAIPSDEIEEGCVLVANPFKFCNMGVKANKRNLPPSSTLLNKFGLTLPPPAELGADRRADLLPVLILVDYDGSTKPHHALLLNRRTGYLIGDLEHQYHQQQQQQLDDPDLPPSTPAFRLGAFMIQPLWFGGTSSSSNPTSSGIEMLHLCPAVLDSKPLTSDGLYYGGDPEQAQEALKESNEDQKNNIITGFDFKFFVQSTKWLPGQLQKEVEDRVWFVAKVSKDVLFKSRDRLGTRRAKPLWTEVMELMGGEYKDVCEKFYADE